MPSAISEMVRPLTASTWATASSRTCCKKARSDIPAWALNWRAKVGWVIMSLRDRWMAFDLASVTVLFVILLKGVRDERIEYSRNLLLSALFLHEPVLAWKNAAALALVNTHVIALDPGPLDGWEYRQARLSSGLSNHAGGVACDFRYDVLLADELVETLRAVAPGDDPVALRGHPRWTGPGGGGITVCGHGVGRR